MSITNIDRLDEIDVDDAPPAPGQLVIRCPSDECQEEEPAPAAASHGDVFQCAYCGEMAAVEDA